VSFPVVCCPLVDFVKDKRRNSIMKKLIAIAVLFVALSATANDKLVASCMMPLDGTIKATSCSNFELERPRDRLFIDGICILGDGTPSKELCPTDNIDAVCIVDPDGENVESFYYNISNMEELDAERKTCEKSIKGIFVVK
jgi:hypothetical protein